MYQANTRVRARSATICDSAACSTARNGPTSLPLGLITPIVAVSTRTQKSGVTTKTTPARTISPAPTRSVRRRPMRSACVVSQG